MTNMNPSLPFPEPPDQSPEFRAKRKWSPPRLTIEQITHTAANKSFTDTEGIVAGVPIGPLS